MRAVKQYSHVHVSNLDPNVTEEDILSHLEKNNFTGVKCTKMNSNRPTEYSSFKLSVYSEDFDKIKQPTLWPEGSRINNFLFRLVKPPGTKPQHHPIN